MKRRIALLLGCLCLTFASFSTNIQAMEQTIQIKTSKPSAFIDTTIKEQGMGDQVSEEMNGVLQIIVCYTAETGEVVPLAGGSGFLIGDDSGEIQNVITSRSNLVVPKKIKKKVAKTYHLGNSDNVQEQIYVVVNKDIMVAATLKAESEELDFAVLDLEQPIHDRNVMVFHDQFTEENLREDLFTIGYPAANTYGKDVVYYSPSQLIQTSGFFEGEVDIDGLKYIKHHIFPCAGNLGGPIVDSEGRVVAINQANYDGENYYAIKISEIMSALDSFSIPYQSYSVIEAKRQMALLEEEARLQEEAEKQEKKNQLQASTEYLELTIQRVKRLELNQYKKSTTVQLSQTLEEAEDFLRKGNYSKEEAEEMAKALEVSTSLLQSKLDVRVICSLVGGVVILISLLIVIILKVACKIQIGSEEKKTPAVFLVGQNTKEEIFISKLPFVIGKDVFNTDYCVTNNKAVSRIHASIVYERGTYCIQDEEATNGTFVNKQRVGTGMKQALKNKDMISLGNEEFLFLIK